MASSEHVGRSWPFDWVVEIVDQLTPEPLLRLASQARASLVEYWPSLADLLPGGGAPEEARFAPPRRSAEPASRRAEPGAVDRAERRAAIDRLKNAARFEERASAARELGARRDPETALGLASALRDASVEVAVAAAEALGGSPSPEARTALVATVRNSDGYCAPPVRASCLRALGRPRTGDERVLVIDALRDVQVDVCLAAIEIAAEVDDRDAADALCALLADRSGFYLPATRLAAARAVASASRSQPARVRELLRQERDPVVAAVLEPSAGSEPS